MNSISTMRSPSIFSADSTTPRRRHSAPLAQMDMVYVAPMSTGTKDAIVVWSAIAGIVVCVFVVLDFFLNRWGFIKSILVWLGKQAMKVRPDSSAVTLEIPPAPPAITLSTGTSDGVTKTTAKYNMCGRDQLLAYRTTREGFPGTRYLVVRNRPNQEPQSRETPDRDEANAIWNEWYQEWKKKGFGGASGTGLSGEPPF